jgi:hypothetical protein
MIKVFVGAASVCLIMVKITLADYISTGAQRKILRVGFLSPCKGTVILVLHRVGGFLGSSRELWPSDLDACCRSDPLPLLETFLLTILLSSEWWC